MNKKFLSAILFGALMVGSTSTFVSCKDYDDDIDGLQEQIDANKKQIDDILAAINGKKFIESYAPVEGGYLLTFTGGETLTIKNGAQGEKGEQGLQGIQGPKGETGATIVPKFKVDAENYWMISVDEGATYEYVLNDAGEKIKAAGSEANVEEAIGNYVKVDEEGYICIGEYRTSFKYNANVPSMIYNEKDGTMQVTIDGQSYTLLMEGSAFNGLQTIVYRKQAADDANDYAVAYQLYYPQNDTDVDTLFAAVPAKASFKVYPSKFSKSDAELFFSDTYQTRAAEQPKLNVLDWDFDKEQDGVIWVKMTPVNFKDALTVSTSGWGSMTWIDPTTQTEISGWGAVWVDLGETINSYATSLDVKMYKQYVSASDYFNVKSMYVSSKEVHNVRVNAEEEIQYSNKMQTASSWYPEKFMSQNDAASYKVGEFDYKGTFNLNDSISAALNLNDGVLLADADIQFEQKFELIDENADKDLWGVTIKKGIFDADKVAKEGILAVKEEKQASAIDEYAVIKVTTTVKSQVEGVHDLVVYNYVLVQAIRPTAAENVATVKLSPLGDATFNLSYKTAKQIVKLDVRAFEDAIGGRDILTDKGTSIVWPLYKADYNTEKELTGYSEAYDYLTNAPQQATWSVDVPVARDEAFVWYKKAEGNATDSLFLFIGPQTEIDKTTLYLKSTNYWSEALAKNGWVSYNGISTPYAAYNKYDSQYFITTINDLAVTRNFAVAIKDAYKARTIIGDWSDAASGNFGIKSENFAHMYDVTPADAKAVFELNKDKQNAFVQELMKENKLVVEEGANGEWRIAFTAPIDIKKVGNLKVDIYDASGYDATDKNRKPDAEELWTVARPIADFTGGAALKAFNDPNLAENTEITLKQLLVNTAGTEAKAKDFWKNLVLKDYAGEKVVTFNGTTFNAEEVTARAALYKKSVTTGLRYIMSNGTDKDEYFKVEPTTGKLTCIALPTGTEFTHTVNVVLQFVHDWGTSEYAYNVTITRKQATR
ncbi:PL29 family lyase N-terminal domain-containing protein [Bacteroides uniformis]|uniref:PL29 family lyase N-terminal domain-containing protein n=1 Tax=Bacteroides uniformis TaxID=820 RepID=UPI00189AA94F|nr:PL29 family lyase N-terminal domain-containing protein [Bacteroides uniformis]